MSLGSLPVFGPKENSLSYLYVAPESWIYAHCMYMNSIYLPDLVTVSL